MVKPTIAFGVLRVSLGTLEAASGADISNAAVLPSGGAKLSVKTTSS